MAIAPTGAIYKSLIFDGEDSRDYGVYITGQAVYNAPERDVEMISIPGRNGSFALDKGRFQNIEVTYPAGIFADTEADFAQAISDFRNFLCSRNGYVRLTDDYNPNEYRMAVYKSGFDVSPAQLKAGEFQLVFDCKPQRFLTSGEEPITIGEWHETETASGTIASFEAKAGDAVKSLVVDIEPTQSGSGTPSPTNIRPISGYDSVVVSRCGKNIANELHHGNISGAGAYGTGDTRVTNATSATSSIIKVTAGQYTLSAQGLDYCTALTKDNNGNIVDNFAGSWHSLPYTFTVTDEAWLYFTCRRSDNASITLADVAVQVEKGSTATAYEPYQGTTYTIDLNGTRYGGTLDVASGVLTVTKVSVDMTAFANNWTVDQEHERCYVFLNDAKAPSAQPADILCNRFETASATEMYSKNAYGVGLSSGKALQFRISGVTDQSTATVTTVTNYFANNPTQVVYKLATPTTVQLTAEEVELLVGLNQVWANSGDVEVEYGTAPNVLVNPTLFESSPMLEVEGYGEIGIGDETISIENTEIGDVLLLNTSFGAKINNFNPSMLNIGDSIYFTNDPPTISIVLESSNTSNPITSVAFSNLTRMNCNYSSKTGTVYAHITSTGSPFTYGTTSQKTAGVTITVTFRNEQTTSFTFTYSVQYDGAGTISIQEGWTGYDITKLKRQVWARGCEIRGYSTKVQAAQPLYIDLDLGEAYGDIDGAMTSMNNIIQMPSKLPTLKSGANTITADNTVTDLKVVPRWWKI